MRKGEVECPSCGAWYRRIEIASMKGEPGEYACLLCGQPLERFSGETYVAYRLTVQLIGRSSDDVQPMRLGFNRFAIFAMGGEKGDPVPCT